MKTVEELYFSIMGNPLVLRPKAPNRHAELGPNSVYCTFTADGDPMFVRLRDGEPVGEVCDEEPVRFGYVYEATNEELGIAGIQGVWE